MLYWLSMFVQRVMGLPNLFLPEKSQDETKKTPRKQNQTQRKGHTREKKTVTRVTIIAVLQNTFQARLVQWLNKRAL